jgi:hypothetical protein
MEEEMKIASAPDMMDDLNQLSLMLFNKPLKDLTDDEYNSLQEYAEEKLAMGGRVGLKHRRYNRTKSITTRVYRSSTKNILN